ncbi:hypothetical protein Agub_g904, partial [Astrephomene gubernaculifera]
QEHDQQQLLLLSLMDAVRTQLRALAAGRGDGSELTHALLALLAEVTGSGPGRPVEGTMYGTTHGGSAATAGASAGAAAAAAGDAAGAAAAADGGGDAQAGSEEHQKEREQR